jgi:hypothetical protein
VLIPRSLYYKLDKLVRPYRQLYDIQMFPLTFSNKTSSQVQ